MKVLLNALMNAGPGRLAKENKNKGQG